MTRASKVITALFLFLLVVPLGFPLLTRSAQVSAATGSDFQAGNIINDSIFFGSNSMSAAQIQAFLNAKVPTCDTNGSQMYNSTQTRAQYGATKGYPAPYTCLKDYSQNTPAMPAEAGLCVALSAGQRSSAQLIYDVSAVCGINPQVLLVLLQKEQSLVTDTWPWPSEYSKATGFGCPDTAPCDPAYGGFFYQVYYAARQFKKYARDAGNYSYLAGRNNSILYNPSASCGRGNVFIQNQATAGLYNYTPYQPNQAALNNLYGTGDSCSAYGNRNFWRMFNDWFGSSTGGVGLIKSDSGGTVYVLYGGQKQGIPSQDVLKAWGLAGLPITTMDDASLNAIATRPTLTRLARNPYNPSVYLLADQGGTYDVLGATANNWGQPTASATDVGLEMISFTKRLGSMTQAVTAPGASAIYLVDGGTKKAFSSPDTLQSWIGQSPITTVSPDLLSLLTNSSGVISNQAQVGSTQYITSHGNLLSLPGSLATAYPRNNVLSISAVLESLLPKAGVASRFVKSDGAGTIYLMDGGSRHGISSLGLFRSYGGSDSPTVTSLSDVDTNAISNGQVITTRFAFDAASPGSQYYVNNGSYTVASNFAISSYGFSMTASGIAMLGASNGSISCPQGLVQAAGSAGIYLLDNGVKRGIDSLDTLTMLNNGRGNVCILSPEDVDVIPTGQPISPFVSNGGINYELDSGSKYSVSSGVASSIGKTSYTPVSNSFIANYNGSTALEQNFKAGDRYTFTNSGHYFSTSNATVARLWGITQPQMHSPLLLRYLENGGELTQFAQPSDSHVGSIYLMDGTKFLPVATLNGLFNAGYTNQNIPSLDYGYISSNLGTVWQGYLAKDSATNSNYVLEGGKKHVISSNVSASWLGTTAPQAPSVLSPDYLSLLATGGDATKSITTNAPGIYGLNDGKKAGIPNINTYNHGYAPALLVTTQLIQSVPDGPAIPSV